MKTPNQQMATTLISVTWSQGDGWAYEQALRYQKDGEIGPDLGPYIDWYEGFGDDLPTPSLGAILCFEEIEAGRFDPSVRA